MGHLLGFFYSDHDDNILDIDLHMLQDLLVVPPSSNFYTVYNVLFHKYGGMNVAVKNSMSQFSMFVPTNATVKFANVNMVHSQGIGIILCHFTNCPIIYPVVPVYYCPCHGIYI